MFWGGVKLSGQVGFEPHYGLQCFVIETFFHLGIFKETKDQWT